MLQRMRNGAGGLPRVRFDTPEEFFSRCAAQSNRLCVWRGELVRSYRRELPIRTRMGEEIGAYAC